MESRDTCMLGKRSTTKLYALSLREWILDCRHLRVFEERLIWTTPCIERRNHLSRNFGDQSARQERKRNLYEERREVKSPYGISQPANNRVV